MQQRAMGLLLGAHGQEILIDRAAASTQQHGGQQ